MFLRMDQIFISGLKIYFFTLYPLSYLLQGWRATASRASRACNHPSQGKILIFYVLHITYVHTTYNPGRKAEKWDSPASPS